MVDLSRSFEPLTLPRPRGAHRYDAFGLKLGRRLTLYGRSASDAWLMIEPDPAVKAFCERPGFIAVNGQRCIVNFWARLDEHEGLILLLVFLVSGSGRKMGEARIDYTATVSSVRRRSWNCVGKSFCNDRERMSQLLFAP